MTANIKTSIAQSLIFKHLIEVGYYFSIKRHHFCTKVVWSAVGQQIDDEFLERVINAKVKICRGLWEKNVMLSASICKFPRENIYIMISGSNVMTHFFVQHIASVNFFNNTNVELSSFFRIAPYKTKLKKTKNLPVYS